MNSKRNPKCIKDSSSDQSTDGETMTSTDFEVPFKKKLSLVHEEEELPNIENDFSRAKAYLMKQCLSSGDNLWDHLNEVLEKILLERPKNIGCTFEEFSYRVKQCRFRSKTDHLLDVYIPPRHFTLSQNLMQILQPGEEDNLLDKSDAEEDDPRRSECDLMEMFYYFEQGGVSLPKEELFCIGVHLKKLAITHPVELYRFWGKILGTRSNYYIAETELKEGEIARLNMEREEEEERIKFEQQEKEAAEEEEMRLKKQAALQELNEREVKLEIERSDAKYAAMVKEAKAKGLTKVPERENPTPWPPIPPLPEAPVRKTVECPREPTGVGVNKKVYFVCRHPGDDWIQLPDVTPQQIVVARKIKRVFTGDLESNVITFPSFPGKEKNLLRAQIARISAGTQISPLGYFTFNEEEEEEEEMESGVEGYSRDHATIIIILVVPLMFVKTGLKCAGCMAPETVLQVADDVWGKSNFVVNPDYEPVALRDLVDSSMAFWVHHSPYILEQGRTTWWNPGSKGQAGEEEGEEEEEEDVLREMGPALLTPLSEDSTMDAVVPWSVRRTSNLYPAHSIAVVRSNLWPGAYAFATERKFDNVYIGHGNKFSASNHSPIIIQDIPAEYTDGPEIMEITDPTPEQEENWRLAHEKKEDDSSPEEGEEEEEERDNEETEDEDE